MRIEGYGLDALRAMRGWLGTLARELLADAARHGPIAGRIGVAQRPHALALDLVQHELEKLSCSSASPLGPCPLDGTAPRRTA